MLLFSPLVMSCSLKPHELQHARPPCPSPSPEVCPSSWPLHQQCHPPISSSDTSFLSSIFPSIRDFTSEWAVGIRRPNTGADSASASVLPMSIQGCVPLRLTGLISLLSKGFSGVFTTTVQKPQFFDALPS